MILRAEQSKAKYCETAHGFVIMMSRKYFDNQRGMKNAIHLQNAIITTTASTSVSKSRQHPNGFILILAIFVSCSHFLSLFLSFICTILIEFQATGMFTQMSKCHSIFLICLSHIHLQMYIVHAYALTRTAQHSPYTFIHTHHYIIFIYPIFDSSTKTLNQTLIDFELTPFNLVKWA